LFLVCHNQHQKNKKSIVINKYLQNCVYYESKKNTINCVVRILKNILKYVLASAFVLAGTNHFINPAFYLKIMPPALPFPLFLVYLSGVFEIALGVLLLIPKFTKFAAWGLMLLLIAVFPANIYMALYAERFPEFSQTAIYWRLPLQFVLIAWSFWYTKNHYEQPRKHH
jgi:uncharacterized membrane protein